MSDTKAENLFVGALIGVIAIARFAFRVNAVGGMGILRLPATYCLKMSEVRS